MHLRCVDRNQRHTLLVPFDIHVPSAPPQSANVSRAVNLTPPQTIATPTNGSATTTLQSLVGARMADTPTITATAVAAAQRQLDRRTAITVDSVAKPAFDAAIDAAGLHIAPSALGAVLSLSPAVLAALRHELEEMAAAAQARQLWFAPLAPQTRYTVDVVAGPLPTGRGYGDVAAYVGTGGLPGIFDASDAIGTLKALQAFLAGEDALTSLQRVQFATSRYETFSDQVANVVAQALGTAATPVRRYAAATDAQAWLTASATEATRATDQANYLNERQTLAAVLGRFNPLYDVRQAAAPADPTTGNGEQALAAQRTVTEQAWQELAAASATTFDGLITALGRPELISANHVPPPPDTELSVFTSENDTVVQALLLELSRAAAVASDVAVDAAPAIRRGPTVHRNHDPVVHGSDTGLDRAAGNTGRFVHVDARLRRQHRPRSCVHHR